MRTLILSSYFKIVQVSGDQAEHFLQSQLTNDLQQMVSEQLQWQAYCARDGLVQSIFGLWRSGSHYYFLLGCDLVEKTCTLLQKYARFSKVTFSVLEDVSIVLTLHEASEKNIHWQITSFTESQLQLTWHAQSFDCTDDLTLLRALLIKHEFPWLCQATSGCFRPHEINLPNLQIVSFKKGCFPGQEIIARMHYRGKLKQGFYTFQLAEVKELLPGQIIVQAEKQVGVIVDAVCVQEQTFVSMVLQHEWCDLPTLCFGTASSDLVE